LSSLLDADWPNGSVSNFDTAAMYDRRSQSRDDGSGAASARDCQKFGTTTHPSQENRPLSTPVGQSSSPRILSLFPLLFLCLSSRQQITQDGNQGLFPLCASVRPSVTAKLAIIRLSTIGLQNRWPMHSAISSTTFQGPWRAEGKFPGDSQFYFRFESSPHFSSSPSPSRPLIS